MVPSLAASRPLGAPAKLRAAASSVAPVASGYEHSLRPCIACFSGPESTTCIEERH
jgi:hypothetical protein